MLTHCSQSTPRHDAARAISRRGWMGRRAAGVDGHRSQKPLVASVMLILAGMGLAERAARSDAMSARRLPPGIRPRGKGFTYTWRDARGQQFSRRAGNTLDEAIADKHRRRDRGLHRPRARRASRAHRDDIDPWRGVLTGNATLTEVPGRTPRMLRAPSKTDAGVRDVPLIPMVACCVSTLRRSDGPRTASCSSTAPADS